MRPEWGFGHSLFKSPTRFWQSILFLIAGEVVSQRIPAKAATSLSLEKAKCGMFRHEHVNNPDYSSPFVGRRRFLLGRSRLRWRRCRPHLIDNYHPRFNGRFSQKIECRSLGDLSLPQIHRRHERLRSWPPKSRDMQRCGRVLPGGERQVMQ